MGYGTPSSYYRKDQTALGGMKLVQYPGEFGTCDEQKLIVWGPSKRVLTTRITLIAFYLRFANAKRMEYLKSRCRGFAPNGRLNSVQDSINEVCVHAVCMTKTTASFCLMFGEGERCRKMDYRH